MSTRRSPPTRLRIRTSGTRPLHRLAAISSYWATAAVYQIGLMYKQFWDDFMAVPVPPDLNKQEAEMYVKLVNEEPQLKKLLEKAVLYHEKNVIMAKNAHLDTQWTAASQAAADEVKQILARQQRGELIAPGGPSGGAGPAGTKSPGAVHATPEVPGDGPAKGEYVPGRYEL